MEQHWSLSVVLNRCRIGPSRRATSSTVEEVARLITDVRRGDAGLWMVMPW